MRFRRLVALLLAAAGTGAGAQEPSPQFKVGNWLVTIASGVARIQLVGPPGAPPFMLQCNNGMGMTLGVDAQALQLAAEPHVTFRIGVEWEHRRFRTIGSVLISLHHNDALAVALLLQRHASRVLEIDVGGHQWLYRLDGIGHAIAPLKTRCGF